MEKMNAIFLLLSLFSLSYAVGENLDSCAILDSSNNVKLYWTLYSDRIHFAFSATPTSSVDSWIAFGFSNSESEAMISNGDCSDAYLVSSPSSCASSPLNSTCVNNCQFCYQELSICDKPSTDSSSFQDFVDTVQNFDPFNITKTQNSFSYEFIRQLNTGGPNDHVLSTTSQVVIWALGDKSGRNYMKHRSDTRGFKTINFSAKSYCNQTEAKEFTFTSPSGDYTAKWTFSSDSKSINVQVEAKTSGWASFGFAGDSSMPNTDVVVAYFDSSNQFVIYDGYITGYVPPVQDTSAGGTNDISNTQGEKSGGILKFSFTKTLVTSDKNDYPLSKDKQSYLFYATGSLSSSDTLLKHSQKGSAKTDFFGGSSSNSSEPKTLKQVHGSLMIISWILIFGTGIVTVHKLKHKVEVWFNSHVAFQVVGSLFTLTAFIIIFIDMKSLTGSPHSIIGVIIFAVMLLQILLGLIGDRIIKVRSQVDMIHRILGCLVYPLAFVNIFLGIYVIEGTIEMYILVAICFVLFFVIYLIPYKGSKESATEMSPQDGQKKDELEKEIPKPVLATLIAYFVISLVIVVVLVILIFVRVKKSSVSGETNLVLEDSKGFDVKFNNFTIPKQQTSYMCRAYKVEGTTQRDAIKFIPIVDNAKVVHHMILFSTPKLASTEGKVWDCAQMPNGVPIWIWAAGGKDFILPQDVGQRYGPNEIQFLALQIHYDMSWTTNYAATNEADSSGVKIVFSDKLQIHQMGIVRLGVPISKISLPAKQAEVSLTGKCPESATTALKNPLKVFSTALHMHFLGKKIDVKQTRNGQAIGTIAQINAWDFNNQQFIPSNATIQAGDGLVTTCVWDTSSKSQVVLGGEDSVKEMCFAFLFFYPRIAGDPESCGA